MTLPRRRVRLRMFSGPLEKKVGVLGPFAIHRAVVGRGQIVSGWHVTHVGTGLAIDGADSMPLQFPTRASAIALARQLKALPVRWDFTSREDMPKLTKRRGRAAANRFARGLARAAGQPGEGR